eukprot:COSAG02_NODE_4222_length_5616_cov_2.976255_4_plen_74_part_00
MYGEAVADDRQKALIMIKMQVVSSKFQQDFLNSEYFNNLLDHCYTVYGERLKLLQNYLARKGKSRDVSPATSP